jgi:hypothetical protein
MGRSSQLLRVEGEKGVAARLLRERGIRCADFLIALKAL